MKDGTGREINYIRISVTDRCNLRCRYCMPRDGVTLLSHQDLLTFEEIERLCRILPSIGVTHIRLTGGEPLVRRGLPDLIRVLKAQPGIETVTMTTNGILFNSMCEQLVDCGLDGVNFSLDTTDAEAYEQLTGSDCYAQVAEAIRQASAVGLTVKVNCVLLDDVSQDIADIASIAKSLPVDVRFIEEMPIGLGQKACVKDEAYARQILDDIFGIPAAVDNRRGFGPARYVSYDGFCGNVGFISALSHQFCHTCNRIRLTSTGYLKTCLQYHTGCDIRSLLRDGSSDQRIKEAIEKAILEKPKGHHFQIDEKEKLMERDIMAKIGG